MIDIKFRIYDKINKKMFYWSKECKEIELEIALLVPKRFIVMQYIGRQDINNKDIYEGDIIVNDMHSQGIVEFFTNLNWDGGGSLHSGFYAKEWFEYKDEGNLSYHDGFDDSEVLGNIYENPELLEKK